MFFHLLSFSFIFFHFFFVFVGCSKSDFFLGLKFRYDFSSQFLCENFNFLAHLTPLGPLFLFFHIFPRFLSFLLLFIFLNFPFFVHFLIF